MIWPVINLRENELYILIPLSLPWFLRKIVVFVYIPWPSYGAKQRGWAEGRVGCGPKRLTDGQRAGSWPWKKREDWKRLRDGRGGVGSQESLHRVKNSSEVIVRTTHGPCAD